jgi:hypothetical protein
MDNKYNRSYESYIINYFEEKNLRQYKKYLIELFKVLPNNSLVSIYKKIKKNHKKPSFAEWIVTDYFINYNINYNLKTKKEYRKKEDPQKVSQRVNKYRSTTNKVSFQCMISKELKKKLEELKKDNNITFEQLLNNTFL